METMNNDIGVVGLAVMGENIIMNLEDKGFNVSVYNRTHEKVTRFVEGRAKNKNIHGFTSVEDFVKSLKKPRKILLMVKAGSAVDDTISTLKEFLENGDIIIDGGNSNYKDTQRRFEELKEDSINYVGTGISGGEEGALNGPSIMPGCSLDTWNEVSSILQKISAKVDNEPCCEHIGPGGAGHFVKMVHNGIEYGDMQLIAETYNILKDSGKTNDELSDIFSKWNEGKLNSYLIEITSQIFSKKENGSYVVDEILDSAGQKGTGKWTAIESLEQGIPLSMITESVYARFISSLVDERYKASKIIQKNKQNVEIPSINYIENALFLSKLISYAQGFSLIKKASDEYEWNINLSNVAKIWRAGCIIRSSFLNDIMFAFNNELLDNLLLSDKFKDYVNDYQLSLRRIVSYSALSGIPLPGMSSALSYLDSYISRRLPANLIQAQRDFFGAHTYEKLNGEKGKKYHTNWTGKGGETSSSSYNA